MDENQIFEKVEEVFHKTFADNTPLTRDTKPGDVTGWDSMGQIRFLANLEQTFSIKFKMKDIVTFRSIGNIVDGIAKLTGQG